MLQILICSVVLTTYTELSARTGMTADDIVSALEGLRALVRDPVTGTYALLCGVERSS